MLYPHAIIDPYFPLATLISLPVLFRWRLSSSLLVSTSRSDQTILHREVLGGATRWLNP